MRIYAVNLNEKRAFQKISREKCVNFVDFQRMKLIFTQPIAEKGMSFANFRQSKCIFTQPIAKKGASFTDFRQSKCIFIQLIAIKGSSFADFRQYDRICTQPIAKKGHAFHKISVFLGGGRKRNLATRHWKKKMLIFSTYLCNQLPRSFYNFIVSTLF